MTVAKDNDATTEARVKACALRLNEGLRIHALLDEDGVGRNTMGIRLFALEALCSYYRRIAKDAGVPKEAIDDMRQSASAVGKVWYDAIPIELIRGLRESTAARSAPKADDEYTKEQREAAAEHARASIDAIFKKK